MKRQTTPWALGLFLMIGALLMPVETMAQDLHPSRRASPTGVARTHVGDAYVTVSYARPYMRRRAIFGTGDDVLVPYGQVWRTGANEGTEIFFQEDVMVNGQRVAAGMYTIFTVPGENQWAFHLSPQLGLWATGVLDRSKSPAFTPNVYDASKDVLQTTVSTQSLDEAVQQFTIGFENAGQGVHLVMSWENTAVRVPIMPAN